MAEGSPHSGIWQANSDQSDDLLYRFSTKDKADGIGHTAIAIGHTVSRKNPSNLPSVRVPQVSILQVAPNSASSRQ